MESLRLAVYLLFNVIPFGLTLLLFAMPLLVLVKVVNHALFVQLELTDSTPS